MLTNIYQIRKIVLVNYYILTVELILGLMVIFFYPIIPINLLLLCIGINLGINFLIHILLAKRASIFILQTLVLLEMFTSTSFMLLFIHYFTDLRPVILMGFFPIIIFSNLLSISLGIFSIFLVLISYIALSLLEIFGIFHIPTQILETTISSNWQEISFFSIVLISLNGVLIVYLKYISSRECMRISWRDLKSHQDLIKKELKNERQ